KLAIIMAMTEGNRGLREGLRMRLSCPLFPLDVTICASNQSRLPPALTTRSRFIVMFQAGLFSSWLWVALRSIPFFTGGGGALLNITVGQKAIIRKRPCRPMFRSRMMIEDQHQP